MATRSVVSQLLRLAGIALLAGILATGASLLPAAPLHASSAAEPGSGVPATPAPQTGVSPALAGETVIAYVDRTTDDIHVLSPGGANRVLWTAPHSDYMNPAIDLVWRPDGRELAFVSTHENACSYYHADVYAIGYDGSGYRRITNAPACARLAALPQGAVKVGVYNNSGHPIWVYVAGAPTIKLFEGEGYVTFDQVADFGPGVLQPAVGIYGMYRVRGNAPYADVESGKTAGSGTIMYMTGSVQTGLGAGQMSWKADGSLLAYVFPVNRKLMQISTHPSYGDTGVELPVNSHTMPNLVAWGRTPATANKYLYASAATLLNEGYHGIWLHTVGDASASGPLVLWDDYSGPTVYDIEWLPDGSGFLTSLFYVGLGYFVDIYRYDFASAKLTQLTHFPANVDLVHNLSISPSGQQVVFERIANRDSDTDSSLWMMNIDGTDVYKVGDHAGRPAWGRTPPPPSHTYVPMTTR